MGEINEMAFSERRASPVPGSSRWLFLITVSISRMRFLAASSLSRP